MYPASNYQPSADNGRLGGANGTCQPRRRLADSKLAVGARRATAAAAPGASARLSQPTRARSRGDGRDPARAAHRDAVERAERDRNLPLELGAPALPGVGRGRCVRAALAPGAAAL